MKILVTGVAGFIGYHVANHLLQRGDEVVGIDNLNDYYDVALKKARLKNLSPYQNFQFIKEDIVNRTGIEHLFTSHKFDRVVHLAAQAGVRYSLENPYAYIDSNVIGFLNILEGCRHNNIEHLVYASSSSVYGANETVPFSVQDNVDHPVSLYAATKKANELMAHSYSHLYDLPTTGLRFFTVYGPWGRPDMSPYLFTNAIMNSEMLSVFNYGEHKRDFTYIDDITEGVIRILDKRTKGNSSWSGLDPDPSSSRAPWRIYNIGNNEPVELLKFIEQLEISLGKTTSKKLLPLQPGDVEVTYANIDDLTREFDFKPRTKIADGVKMYVDWHIEYYEE